MARGAEVFRPPQWNDAPAAPRPFRPFFAASLDGEPDTKPEWLIDGLLMRGTIALFAGVPKVGKSLLMQQLLSAVALGKDWLGRETVSARCFGLFCEDNHKTLVKRQRDINTHFGVEAPDYETGLSWESHDTEDATLVAFENWSDKPLFTDLWHQLWRHVDENGIELLGLDPAGRIFGGNENYKRQTSNFILELHKKISERNGGLILAAHPPKNDPRGYAGSVAWHGSVRLGMSLQRPKGYNEDKDEPRDSRVLKSLGGNYVPGRSSDNIRYEHGVFVVDEPEETERPERFSMDELKYRVMQGMRRVIDNGGLVLADEMHPKSMPMRARRSGDAVLLRTPFNSLYIAQETLLREGKVVRVKVRGQCVLRPADASAYDNEQPWEG
jgi:RecA-family ATPase